MIVPSPSSVLFAASAIGADDGTVLVEPIPGMAMAMAMATLFAGPETHSSMGDFAATVAATASTAAPFDSPFALAEASVPANAPLQLEDLARWASETSARASDAVATLRSGTDETSTALFDDPRTVLSTIALVTASDMIPFVPCQPLAISLGARYGLGAFPVCVIGQTLAGVLAFSSSRRLSHPERLRTAWEALGSDGARAFREFRDSVPVPVPVPGDNNTGGPPSGVPGAVGADETKSETKSESERKTERQSETTVFLALVGLRLAPFFPFSAGNYLLGGATNVGLRPFILATLLGCTVSNAASVLVGMGGAEWLWKQ
eukprot:jgi/Psemu1/288459/fgenesh1_pg.262_\